MKAKRRHSRVSAVVALALLVALAASAGCARTARPLPEWEGGLAEATLTPVASTSATETTIPPEFRTPLPPRAAPLPAAQGGFDLAAAMRHVRAVTAFGVRAPGSVQESRAADYVDRTLRGLGYKTVVETLPLAAGKGVTRNVRVVVPGTSARTLILGAHIDSKPPSPGANDDASGVGILLDLARALKTRPASVTVELDFYGAEEIYDAKNAYNHHAGSRFRAAHLTSAEKAHTFGMLSVDVVGFGTKAHVRTMGTGPRSLANAVIAEGARQGLKVTYLRDPGSSGWSDHEAFEKRGLPAAWLEWLEDPQYHRRGDVASHLDEKVMTASGRLVFGLVRSLDETSAAAIAKTGKMR